MKKKDKLLTKINKILRCNKINISQGEERQIQNQYHLNTLISECKLNGNVEKDKKVFSSWNLKEMFSLILKKRLTIFQI
jgi:hypothetical protein